MNLSLAGRPGVSHLFRRDLLSAAGSAVGAAWLLGPREALASSNRTINVANLDDVDPTGSGDSSDGFQAALTMLQDIGGGVLVIPPGNYVISKPLSFTGQSLAINGAGQSLSVLLIKNPIIVFSITLTSTGFTFTARDFGFSPLMGGVGGTAISVSGVNSGATSQSCILDNIDFAILNPGYTSFQHALMLKSVQRVNIRNANMHSNAGIVPGGSFATIADCVDVRFNNCSIDIVDTAFVVAGYSEGLHIIDTVVANANVAIWTGNSPYSGNGSTTPFVNLLGLYIASCEFNCDSGSAYLGYVDTAWLSDTHFSTGNAAAPALSVLGSSGVQVANCDFTGHFNPATPANWTGIVVASLNGWGSDLTIIDGCLFTNLGLGISIQPGAFNTTALGVRLSYGPGLVGNPVNVGNYAVMAWQDISGNTTNEIQTLASQSAYGNTTSRVTYSRQ